MVHNLYCKSFWKQIDGEKKTVEWIIDEFIEVQTNAKNERKRNFVFHQNSIMFECKRSTNQNRLVYAAKNGCSSVCYRRHVEYAWRHQWATFPLTDKIFPSANFAGRSSARNALSSFAFATAKILFFPIVKKNETEKITEFGFRSFTFASFYVPQKWHFSAAFRRIEEENKGKMKSQNMQFVVRRYRQCKQKTTESTTSAPTNEFDAFQVRARDDACCKNHIMFIAMNSVASGSRFVCTKNH